MTSIFLVAAVVGAILLIASLVMAAAGLEHGGAEHHGPSGDGLQLFSVRALAAGATFFGLGGLATTRFGWPMLLAVAASVVAGFAAMVAVALLMRSMLRLDRDGSVQIGAALGASGTVYVPVPALGAGIGKVLLSLQGRTVELQAVTKDSTPLPTGAAIVVVDVRDDDTVEVVSLPTIDGVL